MSYEYSSSSQNLSLPNPLRVHNYFLAAASLITGLSGLYLLFSARTALRAASHGLAIGTAVVAVLVLALAGHFLFQLLSQLRFYFGRGRPQGLARQLQPDEQGSSPQAEQYIQESLRQQALEYREPGDPLSGLLYSVIPDLIFAPAPVRSFAERQFRAAILTVSLMVGLLTALLLSGDSPNVGNWIALVFFLVAIPGLWHPIAGDTRRSVGLTPTSVPKMVALVAFSILGPTLLSLLVSHLPPPPVVVSPAMLLLLLLLAAALHGLFFAAIARHVMAAPSTTVSMIQETWNLSCNPALVSGEFMRAMQEGWWEQIPNRRYCRHDPQVNVQQRSGDFKGSIVEETQPVPFGVNGERGDRTFSSGDPTLVNAINGYALLMTAVASGCCIWLTARLAAPSMALGSLLAYTVFFWILAAAGFAVARALSLRFDFTSRLFWMEVEGSYVSAEVAQGNLYSSTLRSTSQVIKIEGMTFRMWAAEAHSVAFGKDGERYIYAMVGIPDIAATLATRLREFAKNQATLVSVGNDGDRERMQAINTLAPQMPNPMALPPAPRTGDSDGSDPTA